MLYVVCMWVLPNKCATKTPESRTDCIVSIWRKYPLLRASAKCAFNTLQRFLDVLQTEDHIPQWAMKNMVFIIPRFSSQETYNSEYA